MTPKQRKRVRALRLKETNALMRRLNRECASAADIDAWLTQREREHPHDPPDAA